MARIYSLATDQTQDNGRAHFSDYSPEPTDESELPAFLVRLLILLVKQNQLSISLPLPSTPVLSDSALPAHGSLL